MSLLDHFRPLLRVRRSWQASHNSWATHISSAVNDRLPKGFFAEANVQFGIEVDVGAFDEGKNRQLVYKGGNLRSRHSRWRLSWPRMCSRCWSSAAPRGRPSLGPSSW